MPFDGVDPGLEALRDGLLALRDGPLQFPPAVDVVEWVEKHGRLSREVSAEPGEVRLYGYQRGLLEAMVDPRIPELAILKGARVGYTQLLSFATAYFIAHEAASVLIAEPTDDDARDFGKTQIDSMFREMPILSELLRTPVRGEALDTWSDRRYRNGAVLRLRGAASDDAFRRYTSRVVAGDEIDADAWRNTSINAQGDKLKLMAERSRTFWNRKRIIGSTPNLRESSLIWREWLLSDQRRYFVPCPICGEMQYLKWGGKDKPYGIKWSLDEEGNVQNAWYVCEHCGSCIEEADKAEMDANGEWRPTARAKRPGLAGFHVWAGMSLFPGASWRLLAQEWLDAQSNPDLLQPFVNLVLGEPWDALEGKTVEPEGLADRREPYPAECPDEVVVITAGVDNQSGSEDQDAEGASRARIEVSIWGWGRGEESWLLGHWVLDRHDPYSPESIEELDALLARPFLKRDGTEMRVAATAVDLGGGYTQEVKDFCRLRFRRNIWAVKGRNQKLGTRTASVWPRKASRKDGNAWYMIDTQLAKDALGRRLKIEAPGPGYCHFPESADDAYFDGLTAEKLVIDKRGNRFWRRRGRNTGEPWDCFVYAYAALQGLKSTYKRWRDLSLAADRMGIPARDPDAEADGAEAVGPDRSAQSARRQAELAQEAKPAPPSAAKASPEKMPEATAAGQAAAPVKTPRKPRVRRVARSVWMGR